MRSTWIFACSAVLAFSSAGCDCSGGLTSTRPCSTSRAPDGCGDSCAVTRSCPSGLYCGADDRCTADCLVGDTCPDGLACPSNGRCGAGSMDSGMGGGVDANRDVGPAPDRTCAAVELGATRTTPNVIFVIDRSGSMDTDFDMGMTRWEVLETAITGMPDGIVFTLQSSVRFGFAMYSDQGGVPGCPDLETVPCALDNFGPIRTEYRMHSPGGDTPTGDSITAVLGMLDTVAPERSEPTIFILATDGEPDTCEDGDDEVNGRRESLEAVQAAFALDPPIRTYVISVGTDVGASHLQEFANAGVGVGAGGADAPFWVATDTAGLVSAIETIVGGALSCVVTLEGMIDPAAACDGTVRLGTDELTCGTDWRAVDETHIELLGAACDRLQTSDDVLTATFPCGVILM